MSFAVFVMKIKRSLNKIAKIKLIDLENNKILSSNFFFLVFSKKIIIMSRNWIEDQKKCFQTFVFLS